MKEIKGKWALVTGASSGIGADLARVLGKAGCHLVLTARRKDRLEALKKELTAKHSINIETISNDLSTPTGAQKLFDSVEKKGIPIAVLINNAGIGIHGPFSESDWDAQRGLLQLNITSVMELTHRFLEGMLSRNEGWILQVASLYAFNKGPGYASYCASKHFVLSISESLNYELKGQGVKVTALCPGVTKTEFFEASGQGNSMALDLFSMDSMKVAKIGVKALVDGKPYVVPGLGNQVVAEGVKYVPKALQLLTTSQIIKK